MSELHVLLALAAGTLVSEDGACLAAGVLVARGALGPASAVAACWAGIVAGDLLLYAAGRWMRSLELTSRSMRSCLRASGTLTRQPRMEDAPRAGVWLRLTRTVPLMEALTAAAGRAAGAWIGRRAPLVVFAARFLPGVRLPSYVAAGALGMPLASFAASVGLGAALSTPLLVGATALAARRADVHAGTGSPAPVSANLQVHPSPILQAPEGESRAGIESLSPNAGAPGRDRVAEAGSPSPILAILAGGAVLVALRLLVSLATYRGRRMCVSTWRRATRWEFWPAWILYVPVAAGILRLAMRHRSLTVFTAANPAIPGGGLVGESKASILEALQASGAPVAPFILLRASAPIEQRLGTLGEFMRARRVSLPVVVKPDVGQRGAGVRIVREPVDLDSLVREARVDLIVQSWVGGVELGVFYVRRPDEARGRIFSITRKVLPEVEGDGRRSLERLILDDDRAVCMARVYLGRFRERLSEVPARGERIPLAEIGNHCRGAIFLDGASLRTPALERRIDDISRGYRGFFFGRYDLKAPSIEAFRQGCDLTILELNGVGSESTNIYDPATRLSDAWRTLLEQWRLAFEIGAANRSLGARIMPFHRVLSAKQ